MTDWDVIVVGAGMGGATLGHALAQAGHRVLFVEKGAIDPRLRGIAPESSPAFAEDRDGTLREAGRSLDEIEDRGKRFRPFIGNGGGGSSALYGMAMERFFREDFTPRRHHRDADTTLPEAWPVSYDDMAPWYAKAEALYRVRGQTDPLRPAADAASVRAPPPLSPANAQVAATLAQQGLHPYTLHLACEDVPGCTMCEGMLCPRECKRDAASTCLTPAIRDHGAEAMDRTTVVAVEADRTRVTGVIATRGRETLTLRARHVVLAAGALVTPALLLASACTAWPRGVANASDQLGRNLMRHAMELIFLRGAPRRQPGERAKEISVSDFYLPGPRTSAHKLGTLQSLGPMPETAAALAHLSPTTRMLIGPLVKAFWERRVRPLTALATILEDTPRADNRVLPGEPFASDSRQRIRMQYRFSAYDLERAGIFHGAVVRALKPLAPRTMQLARRNAAIAHACGTCRFGSDPATSVLDADNRAHGLDNLYVVDASFFPSSSGTNPALTIAANALRVAAHLRARL